MSAKLLFQKKLQELYDSGQVIIDQAIIVEKILKPDLIKQGISDQEFLDTLRYFIGKGCLKGYTRSDDLEMVALTTEGSDWLAEQTALGNLSDEQKTEEPKDQKYTTLKEIDNRIISIKQELAGVKIVAKEKAGSRGLYAPLLKKVEDEIRDPLIHEQAELEVKRRAILDQNRERREGWMFKLFWLIVGAALAYIITLLTS